MYDRKTKKEEVAVITPTNYVPPNFKRRQLIFDSFVKLKNKTADKDNKQTGQNRGVLMYSWGAGYHGQLGLNTQLRKKCVLKPKRLDFDDPVIQISCGGFHSACVTENGRVYTWGDGQLGQLGNLHSKHNMTSTPHVVENFLNSKTMIKQVACGQYHTACVSKNGQLYTWGSGKYGQHGHGSRLSERWPKRVEIVDPDLMTQKGLFTQVSCGDRHTAAVMTFFNKPNRVVTFGSGTHGQLGHGNTDDCNWPKVLTDLDGKGVTTVACGATHTAAVCEDGALYLWGFGESIHPKPYNNIVDAPRLVKLKSKIKAVALGQSHVLALSWDGDVFAWGNSQMGQIGHGSRGDIRKPRLVLKGKEIFEIAAGRYHSLAVSTYGILFSWGCGESGQLAHGSLDSKLFPTVVDAGLQTVIGQVSCGEHHSLAISSIPHAAVSQDVTEWLEIEQEELKLKSMMLKEFPNGLKTKHILDIARNRKRLVDSMEEQRAKEQDLSDKHLKEQLSSIQTRKTIAREVKEAMNAKEIKTQDSGRKAVISRPQSAAATKQLAMSDDAAATGEEGEEEQEKVTEEGEESETRHLSGAKSTNELGLDEEDVHRAQRMSASASQPVLMGRDSSRQRPHSSQQASRGYGGGSLSHAQSSKLISNLPLARVQKSAQSLTQRSSVDDGEYTARNNEQNALELYNSQETFYPLAARVQFFERSRVVLERVKSSLQAPAIVNLKPQLVRAVFKMKQDNNKYLAQKHKKQAKLKELQREYDLLYLTNDEVKTAELKQARIKQLKMKLVTLNTRLMEAEENKRNYELYILRMKEEDVQLSKQIDDLRQRVMETDREMKKKAKKNSSIVQRKIELDEEIVAFNADIDEFSIFAGQQLSKYKRLIVDSIGNTRKAEEDLRVQQNLHNKDRNKKFGQIDERRAMIDEQEREIKSELVGWSDKVQYYEKRFHKITSATGLTDAKDIVNKFFFNEEVTSDLQKDVKERKAVIAKLEEEHDSKAAALADKKGDHVFIKWKDIAAKHDMEFDKTQFTKKKGDQLLKWNQKLTYVNEGIVGLVQDIELVVNLPKFEGEPDKFPAIDTSSKDLSGAVTTWLNALTKRSEHLQALTKETEIRQAAERKQKEADEREALATHKAATALFGGLAAGKRPSTKFIQASPKAKEKKSAAAETKAAENVVLAADALDDVLEAKAE